MLGTGPHSQLMGFNRCLGLLGQGYPAGAKGWGASP